MGYRSDVAAVFYVTHANEPDYPKAKALLDLWYAQLKETKWHRDDFGDCFSSLNKTHGYGYTFQCEEVKWYDSYPNVRQFDEVVKKYHADYIDNDELDGGSGLNKYFCYEFVRIGEETDDIVEERSGDHDYLLYVARSIAFS